MIITYHNTQINKYHSLNYTPMNINQLIFIMSYLHSFKTTFFEYNMKNQKKTLVKFCEGRVLPDHHKICRKNQIIKIIRHPG